MSQNLKGKLIQGGLYLAIRQLVSVGLSLVSILVIARILGTENYGILVSALGIFNFLIWTGKLGLNIFLIKQQDLDENFPAEVQAFYSSLGIVLGLALWLLAPLIGMWTGRAEIADLVRLLPIPIWLDLVGTVAISMLERELEFKKVGLVEILGQMANYSIAIVLVLSGWSYWGPIVGLMGHGLITLLAAQYYYRVPWRWRWRWQTLRPGLDYGLTFAFSHWVISLKILTIPLLVTPLAGVEVAGLVSIAIRLVDQLSVLRLVIRRMSISVMSRLTDNVQAIRRTVSRGMAYQALMIGTVCGVFACFDGWVIPIVFGPEWLPSTQIFPFIALSAMVRAMFDMHAAALYAVGHNKQVAKAYMVYILLLWLGCITLIPKFGLWGYGLAELLTILSHLLLHQSLQKLYQKPAYSTGIWLAAIAMVPILSGNLISPIAGMITFAISYGLALFIPSVRAVAFELVSALRNRKIQSA